MGGARKKAVNIWATAINKYLNAVKDLKKLEFESILYDRILIMLRSQKTEPVEAPSKVMQDLRYALDRIRALNSKAYQNIKILKSKSNQILIGNGNTGCHPREGRPSGNA